MSHANRSRMCFLNKDVYVYYRADVANSWHVWVCMCVCECATLPDCSGIHIFILKHLGLFLPTLWLLQSCEGGEECKARHQPGDVCSARPWQGRAGQAWGDMCPCGSCNVWPPTPCTPPIASILWGNFPFLVDPAVKD